MKRVVRIGANRKGSRKDLNDALAGGRAQIDAGASADVPPAEETAPAATPADDTEPSTGSDTEPPSSDDTAPSAGDTPAPSAGDISGAGDAPPGADLPQDDADPSRTRRGVACGAGFLPILGMLFGVVVIRRTAPTPRR